MESTARKSTHLLIESDFLHEGAHSIRQVGLPGTNRSWSSQGQVVVEAMAKSAPGVKQTLQTPAHIAYITIEWKLSMLAMVV